MMSNQDQGETHIKEMLPMDENWLQDISSGNAVLFYMFIYT